MSAWLYYTPIIVLGVLAGVGWITLYHVIYPLKVSQLFLWIGKGVVKYWLNKELIQSENIPNQTNDTENGKQVAHPNVCWIWGEIKHEEEISCRRHTDNNNKAYIPPDKPTHDIHSLNLSQPKEENN